MDTEEAIEKKKENNLSKESAEKQINLFLDRYEKENKLSKESAEKQVELFLDYYEIDIDNVPDKQQKSLIKNGMGRLVKAVRKGRLEIIVDDGSIKVTQTLAKNPDKKIEYPVLRGTHKTSMGDKGAEDYYGRAYALMGSLSGLGESAIEKLEGVDLSLVEVLGMLFLQV